MVLTSRLGLLRDAVKKGGLIMGVDIGMKNTGIVFWDLWSRKPFTFSLVKMRQGKNRKSPLQIATILQKLIISSGSTHMVVGMPNGYPPPDGIGKDFLHMANDIAKTGLLSSVPLSFEDEFGTSAAAEKIKTESVEMQQREGGVHMMSAYCIVERYLAECCTAQALEDFRKERLSCVSSLQIKRG